jgi:hypothetical protein
VDCTIRLIGLIIDEAIDGCGLYDLFIY